MKQLCGYPDLMCFSHYTNVIRPFLSHNLTYYVFSWFSFWDMLKYVFVFECSKNTNSLLTFQQMEHSYDICMPLIMLEQYDLLKG